MKSTLLLLHLIIAVHLTAQSPSSYPDVPFTSFRQIEAKGETIFALGDCEVGMISTDNGSSWEYIELPLDIRNFTFSINADDVIYLMSKQKVYQYDAITKTITQLEGIPLAISGDFVSIRTHNNDLFLIGESGILKTSDYTTWSTLTEYTFDNDFLSQTDITDQGIHLVTFNGRYTHVSLSDGLMSMTYDFGERQSSFDMISDMIGYSQPSSGQYSLKTSDGGNSWSPLTNMPENINPTGYGDNVTLTINTNRLYRSVDGGATSSFVGFHTDDKIDLIGCYFITPEGVLYLAGQSSTILRSDDFGLTLSNINPYKRADLHSISSNQLGTIYAVGGNSTIFYTSDDGATWSSIENDFGNNNYLNSVAILPSGKAVLCTNDGIYALENGTATKTSDLSGQSIIYNNQKNYLIATTYENGEYAISKSTDNGSTWQTKTIAPEITSKLFQAPSGKLYLPKYSGSVLVSTDDGETWTDVPYPDFPSISEVAFYDDEVGLLAQSNKLYLTEDGGQSHQQIHSGYFINNLQMISNDHFFFTTAQNFETQLFESKDRGQSITNIASYCNQTHSSHLDGNTLWLGQDGGHINKISIISTSSKDKEISKGINVFPNPIQHGTPLTIESISGPTTINIYNITGVLVFSKVYTNQEEKVELMLPSLLTGTYIIEYKENSFRKHQKLLVY